MSVADAVGVLGVVLYLVSYFLLQIEMMRFDDYSYLLINMAAALLIIFSLISQFNLSAFLVEVLWVMISVIGIARRWYRDRNAAAQAETCTS